MRINRPEEFYSIRRGSVVYFTEKRASFTNGIAKIYYIEKNRSFKSDGFEAKTFTSPKTFTSFKDLHILMDKLTKPNLIFYQKDRK